MPRLAKPLDLPRSTRNDRPAHSARSERLTLGEALDRWDTYLQGSDRIGSPRTLDAYRYAVAKLVAVSPGHQRLADIRPADLEALFASLKASGMSPAGRSAVYRPLRTFFRWCVRRGLLASSPADMVEAPKVKVQPVEFVTDQEWQAILATCSTRSRWAFRPRRDLAILQVLATTGARLSEVAGLTLSDIEGDTIRVHGKGGKDRLLPLLPEAAQALDVYLTHERPRSPFSGAREALWLASKGPMTANGIAQMLGDRGKAAGIARRVHPHELRHRFVAGALAKGMPDALVMALSGHSTPSMLQRYGAYTRQADAMQMWRELNAAR